jgi:tryptophan halogenase
MARAIEKVLIVGGGTAGWLAGAYLARRLGASRPGGIQITLIESSDIAIVGVGEGTFPAIKKLVLALGVEEAVFMRACSAAFKQGFALSTGQNPPSAASTATTITPSTCPRRPRAVSICSPIG